MDDYELYDVDGELFQSLDDAGDEDDKKPDDGKKPEGKKPDDKKPDLRSLEERDRAVILKDMDKVLPDYLLNKIWEMIWKRWNYYESM